MDHTAIDFARTVSTDLPASGFRRSDLHPGDVLVVRTRNSVYTVRSLGDGSIAVAGGWFDSKPSEMRFETISGCTWGGTALARDLIAAPGMHLEFGGLRKRVVTSLIQDVCYFPNRCLN
jgi:hypothetical protein